MRRRSQHLAVNHVGGKRHQRRGRRFGAARNPGIEVRERAAHHRAVVQPGKRQRAVGVRRRRVERMRGAGDVIHPHVVGNRRVGRAAVDAGARQRGAQAQVVGRHVGDQYFRQRLVARAHRGDDLVVSERRLLHAAHVRSSEVGRRAGIGRSGAAARLEDRHLARSAGVQVQAGEHHPPVHGVVAQGEEGAQEARGLREAGRIGAVQRAGERIGPAGVVGARVAQEQRDVADRGERGSLDIALLAARVAEFRHDDALAVFPGHAREREAPALEKGGARLGGALYSACEMTRPRLGTSRSSAPLARVAGAMRSTRVSYTALPAGPAMTLSTSGIRSSGAISPRTFASMRLKSTPLKRP